MKDIEQRWLSPSTEFMGAQFEEVFLPSHDLFHHLRTWKFGKEILEELDFHGVPISAGLIEGVLLSSLFHDAGMVITRAAEHGEHSVVVYDRFLQQSSLGTPSRNQEIRRVIREHDDKENVSFVPFSRSEEPDMLTVMSIADNLDALGTTGIYRYAEIYLHRNVPLRKLGTNILENVSIRYKKIAQASQLTASLNSKHAHRFQQITSFCKQLNSQLVDPENEEIPSTGPAGVLKVIKRHCVEGIVRPEKLHELADIENSGKFVQDYFETLHHELSH